jgi:hypothetical protein
MEWIESFHETHMWQQQFDEVWMSMPPFPGLTRPLVTNAYQEVTQWQGKEMRNLWRFFLGAFAIALRNPSADEKYPFRRSIHCIRIFIDFHLIVQPQYRSHTLETLQYMDQYLANFHQNKNIFLEFRVSKKPGAKARESV